MAWDNKKNKRILTCIIFGEILWTMANVSHGTVYTDESENEEKENTITRMRGIAANRRENVFRKTIDRGSKMTVQQVIGKIPPWSGYYPVIAWAAYRAGRCGKSRWGGTIDKLIAAGADVNERDEDNVTALHEAAKYGCFRIAKRLLEYGADPNVQAFKGITPLHYATLFGHLGIVHLLLTHGANPNIQSNDGETPLDYAISRRKRMCRKENREELKRIRKKFNVGPKKNYDKIIRLLRKLSAD
ncbi:MAG: ankyrin repeat domain-containing protein [Puniceicoccales bacterium]|jgi:hypothetical protein|nr:ankyrin repeat domain-containing protein [Puniceicoccales bacterium]